MCYRWQLRVVAHTKACQAAGSCGLLFCLRARRNSRVSTQSLFPTSPSWLTRFPFFSFSITLLGVLSDHQWEIPLQWKADKWHVILLSGRNPTAQASLESDVFIDICSASINRRINRAWQKNQWCTLSYYLSWPKMNTDVNNKIG